VVYRSEDGERSVAARREVIVSAGAICSPQLLLLSGIGGRNQLDRFGIPLVAEVPGVGENLQDHPMVPVNYRCARPVTLGGAVSEEQAARYATERMGLLSSNLAEVGGFTEIRDRDIPELQFHFGPLFFIHHGAGNPEGHGFVGFSIAVRPRSRGRVELRSANPADKPVIDPNMLDDEADTQVLVDGIRVIRDIVSCPALDEFRGEPYPAAAAAQSDDELRDYVRDYTQSLYHPVGTCRMGTDPAAVVDPQLRVRGVEGLRVADASIMPIIVNANTNFPSIMIGNKCAELILTGN
jgi:choline dehydrogenase